MAKVNSNPNYRRGSLVLVYYFSISTENYTASYLYFQRKIICNTMEKGRMDTKQWKLDNEKGRSKSHSRSCH